MNKEEILQRSIVELTAKIEKLENVCRIAGVPESIIELPGLVWGIDPSKEDIEWAKQHLPATNAGDKGQAVSIQVNHEDLTVICPHCGKEHHRIMFTPNLPYQFVCGPTVGCGKTFEVPAFKELTVVAATTPALDEQALQSEAEELWDKYSQYIEDSVFEMERFAGTNVVTKLDFLEAIKAAARKHQADKKQVAEAAIDWALEQSRMYDDTTLAIRGISKNKAAYLSSLTNKKEDSGK